MIKLEVGKKYKIRDIKDAKYAEVIEKIENEAYPYFAKIVYSDVRSEFGIFNENGRYDLDNISRYDLVGLLEGYTYGSQTSCQHQYEQVLLFNCFHDYCKMCGVKK